MSIFDNVQNYVNSLKTKAQGGIQNWAQQNPQQAQRIINAPTQVRNTYQNVMQSNQLKSPIPYTPPSFTNRVQQVAKPALQTYIKASPYIPFAPNFSSMAQTKQNIQNFAQRYPGATQQLLKLEKPVQAISKRLQNPYNPVSLSQVKTPYKYLNLGYNYVGKPILEDFINMPRNYIGGTVKTGLNLGRMARGEKVPVQKTLGGIGQVGGAILTAGMLPFGGGVSKNIVKNVAKNYLKDTLWSSIKQGIKSGAKYGTAYGLFGGLKNNEDVDNLAKYTSNVLKETATSGVVGGSIGGGTALLSYTAGKILGGIRSAYLKMHPEANDEQVGIATREYLRDKVGRFTKQGKEYQVTEYIKNIKGDKVTYTPVKRTYKVGKEPQWIREADAEVMKNLPKSRPGLTTKPLTKEEHIALYGNKPPKIPPNTTPEDADLITRLREGLRQAKDVRGQQQNIYAEEKAQRLGKVIGIREKMGGEQGFFQEKGALKGEYTKVDYEPVRQLFKQPEIDQMYNMIKKSNSLTPFEKVDAQEGLALILGKKGGAVPQPAQIEKLYKVFGKDLADDLLAKRTVFQKLGDAGMQLYNLPRSMMTFMDLSATLMQNLMFAYRHPVMTLKNLGKEIKMFGNEKYFQASQNELAARPNAQNGLYDMSNLQLTDLGSAVSKREEQFMSSWAEQIPGIGKLVRSSGRAYTGFLNRMRADTFDQLVEAQKGMGGSATDAKFLKDAGEFVNAATGRGSLGKFEQSANLLAQGLFSPRKLVATAKFLDPRLYITSSPAVRKEALKTVTSFVGGGMSILTLAKLGGADVGTDPTSSDFGKIKIGNTRLNVFGPYQQIAVLLGRLFKGYMTSSTTGGRTMLGDEESWKPMTTLDLVQNWIASKEHPTISLIADAMRGTTGGGQKFNWGPEILDRMIPMVLSDGYDLYKEHGPIGLLGTIPTILGVPTQTYGKQFSTLDTTPSGKTTIKLNPETGLSQDIWNKITSSPKSNIPETVQSKLTPLRQRITKITQFKDTIKNMPIEERKQFVLNSIKNGTISKEDLVKIVKGKPIGTSESLSTSYLKVQPASEKITYLKSLTKGKKPEEKLAIVKNLLKKKVITIQDLESLKVTK